MFMDAVLRYFTFMLSLIRTGQLGRIMGPCGISFRTQSLALYGLFSWSIIEGRTSDESGPRSVPGFIQSRKLNPTCSPDGIISCVAGSSKQLPSVRSSRPEQSREK